MTKPYTVAGLEPLMTLEDAATSIGLRGAQLRTEIRKGRLTPTVVAGKHYVTESALRDMLDKCRADQKALASTCETPEQPVLRGLSSTAKQNVARDAARLTVQGLKKRSRTTSPANTSQ